MKIVKKLHAITREDVRRAEEERIKREKVGEEIEDEIEKKKEIIDNPRRTNIFERACLDHDDDHHTLCSRIGDSTLDQCGSYYIYGSYSLGSYRPEGSLGYFLLGLSD